jgi:hypothetical protein
LCLVRLEIRKNVNCQFKCRRRIELINSKIAGIVQGVICRVLIFEKGQWGSWKGNLSNWIGDVQACWTIKKVIKTGLWKRLKNKKDNMKNI